MPAKYSNDRLIFTYIQNAEAEQVMAGAGNARRMAEEQNLT